jgi:hypothetical protein
MGQPLDKIDDRNFLTKGVSALEDRESKAREPERLEQRERQMAHTRNETVPRDVGDRESEKRPAWFFSALPGIYSAIGYIIFLLLCQLLFPRQHFDYATIKIPGEFETLFAAVSAVVVYTIGTIAGSVCLPTSLLLKRYFSYNAISFFCFYTIVIFLLYVLPAIGLRDAFPTNIELVVAEITMAPPIILLQMAPALAGTAIAFRSRKIAYFQKREWWAVLAILVMSMIMVITIATKLILLRSGILKPL